jgi:hypothetical protein
MCSPGASDAEEVVESTLSANPSKYRAVDEAQAHGDADEDDDGGDNAAAVADEDFDWLEPKDFVAAYKASEHYAHVIDTINDTNKDLAPHPDHSEHTDDHAAKIELVDYARDAKYPTSTPTYDPSLSLPVMTVRLSSQLATTTTGNTGC